MLLSLLVVAQAAPATANYDVSVAEDLSTLTVRARFEAPVPAALEPLDGSARKYLSRLSINGVPASVPNSANAGIALEPLADHHDVSYVVNLRAAARAGRYARAGPVSALAVLIDPALWLWLPPRREPGQARLRFHLPPGMSVSAPWPQMQAAHGAVEFEIGKAHMDLPALMAIGRFEIQSVGVPGAELRFALLDGDPAPDREAIRNWVRSGATAVAGLYGKFPLQAPQILVVPTGKGDEPVPWGQVLRGGGTAAHLFIDQSRSVREFQDDWVLVHELSHMLHPNLHRDGAWLAEGLATYYQNVLRARAGLLTRQQAWQKLHEGFQRGIAGTEAGIKLEQATRDMREKHGFMRVYWSGAAIVLLGDLELRRAGSSLDLVLSRFHDCCLDDPREWPAAEFLETLDQLAGIAAFMPLYRRYLQSDQFPDLRSAYLELGLQVQDGKTVQDDVPAAQALRESIMGQATSR